MREQNKKYVLIEHSWRTTDDPWYAFRIFCPLFEQGQSNMSSSSSQRYCLRKGKDGKERRNYELLRCSKLSCPILNGKIPPSEHQKEFIIEFKRV